jgi:eukaryotic-like serine/threonine-protein kinase
VPVHTRGSLLGGRYRILRHLGSGGMASVLLCQDQRLDRQVAVKRLHADSPTDVEHRFVREAKLGASLNHPNLVSVFDTATDDEGVLIVMEYVEGEALSRALRRGPLEPPRVAAMVRDLAAALDHAHAHGVVHRDVKPGNVLLRHDGVTKLVDLGIATASDQTRITRSGTVLGTAAYMAPEQIEGGAAGPAADVYALAVVAYEALAGERPRAGRTPLEIAHRIATSPPPDLRDALPGAPPGAATALERGMAREPGERPASAGELAGRLARALEEPPTAPTRSVAPSTPPPAAPPPPLTPTGRRRERRPVGAIAVALVVLVLAAVGVAAAVLSSGDGGDDAQPRAEQPPAERGRADDEARPGEERQRQPQQQATPAPEPEAEPEPPAEQPAPAQPAPEEPAPSAPADGAELNEQGFALMQQGDYAGAIPILQRAVESFGSNTGDLNYAYALFNLGQSLRLAGRPDEAIPILEQRLEIPNQTGTVRRELEAAKRDAGRS